MIDKFKYVWKRLTARTEGNLARDDFAEWSEVDKTREKLTQMRARQSRSTTTNSLDITRVRQRITQEVENVQESNCVTVRERDRQAISRWFRPEDQTESGNFDCVSFNQRMEEAARSDAAEDLLEPFPEIEDTFMAFSKPEEDLFDEEERITLSGVNYAIDPLEELEEEYTTPALPMFRDGEAPSRLDLEEADELARKVWNTAEAQPEPEMDFSPEEEECPNRARTSELLTSLQHRLNAANGREDFWVESGY